MQYTENYQMNLPEGLDYYNVEDFNNNTRVIDTTMYTHDLHVRNSSNPHGVTKEQVGLGNVGNYKAVSTSASQGLTASEQQNAKDNIGIANIAATSGGQQDTLVTTGDKYNWDHKSFSGLSDVNFTSLANGQVPIYNSTTQKWENETVSIDASGKMDKDNPTGIGALSLNRAENTTVGSRSVAVGNNCTASRSCAVATGDNSLAQGLCSHAEGYCCNAYSNYSRAEGYYSVTSNAQYSHASGYRAKTGCDAQTAVGKCNRGRTTTLFEVGNGTYNESTSTITRKNIFEVYEDGSLSTDDGTTKTKLPIIRSAILAAYNNTVIIPNVPNTGTCFVDFYTSVPGLDYTAISVDGTGVTLTYPVQTTDTTVYAVITEVTS